jgi:ribonuclease J
VELESGGVRLLLDLGLPLGSRDGEVPPLPPVPGLEGRDPSLLGILLSHIHADHCGLAHRVPEIPMGLSARANAILRAAEYFSPHARAFPSPRWAFEDGKTFEVGPFRVMPFVVDHSAFDAFALLVEADGRRLLYTGDLRAHGWKGRLFDRLARRVPKPVDVLMLEGTHVRTDVPDAPGPTESDVVARCAELFRSTRGLAFVVHSAQNLDRLVTIWKAARRAGRKLAIDLYSAAVASACGAESIPRPGFDSVVVYVPEWQRRLVKRTGEYERVNDVRNVRVFGDGDLEARPDEYVVACGEHAVRDLDREGLVRDSVLVWSLWKGYLDDPDRFDLRRFVEDRGGRFELVHSSGHAYVEDLQALAREISPDRVVPIHTFAPDRFGSLFSGVAVEPDGRWWEV